MNTDKDERILKALKTLPIRQQLQILWWSLARIKKYRIWEIWVDKGMHGRAAYDKVTDKNQ